MRKTVVYAALVGVIVGLVSSSVCAESVLWDTRHSAAGYDYLSDHGALVGDLTTNQGYAFSDSDGVSFTDENLANYGSVVVSVLAAEGGAYTGSEVAQLADYVYNGGGLLILGENSYKPNANIEPLSKAFGVTLSVWDIPVTGLDVPYFAEHEIFNNVDTIHFQAPGEIDQATGIEVLTPATELAWADAGHVYCLIAGTSYGDGYVVTIGDTSLLRDTYLGEQDNLQFAVNTFDYITAVTNPPAAPEPATVMLLGLGAVLLRRKR